ncbi:hypothetical protein PAECIP112173_04705 [Paenibacillus sp. JJ-100]|uniref:DUF58 domain-containing protein n=1 Tax=Paenibacillus sp. JJ-100 TaxID=2974896 RepID=UPI0022FFB5F0|nr:DUF58 domain-containing protein [Paenibacillus sp. JJ-100]CAI6085628.1 hypothetical protein PAECIP112173_04705 [Paenibacillus sp. JJ-100]
MNRSRGSLIPMLISVLLGGFYLWHGGKAALFLLAVSVLIVIYGQILHIFGPRHVHIHRNIRQGQIAAGESMRVQVELQLRSPLPLMWLMVCDSTPGGVHRKLLFPGLKRRWSYQYEITGLPRGVHAWEEGRVYWGDIFGWNRAYAPIQGEEPVVVVPASGNDGTLFWSGGWSRLEEGMGAQSQVQGGSGTEVREYQQGDSFNRIHWKSTARTGKLHTRITEMSPSHLLTIMVYEESSGYESFVDENQTHESFERAVQGAASWAYEAANIETPFRLWLSGEALVSQAETSTEGVSWSETKTSGNDSMHDGRGISDGLDEELPYALKKLAYAQLRKDRRVSPGVRLDVSKLELLPHGSSIVIFTGHLDERLVVWLEYAAVLGFQTTVYLTETSEETEERTPIGKGLSSFSREEVTSNSSIKTGASEEWATRLISQGIRVVNQEDIEGNDVLLSGKAGIVDVGA